MVQLMSEAARLVLRAVVVRMVQVLAVLATLRAQVQHKVLRAALVLQVGLAVVVVLALLAVLQ